MNARKQKTVDNIDKYIFSSLKYVKNIILSLLNEGLSTESESESTGKKFVIKKIIWEYCIQGYLQVLVVKIPLHRYKRPGCLYIVVLTILLYTGGQDTFNTNDKDTFKYQWPGGIQLLVARISLDTDSQDTLKYQWQEQLWILVARIPSCWRRGYLQKIVARKSLDTGGGRRQKMLARASWLKITSARLLLILLARILDLDNNDQDNL